MSEGLAEMVWREITEPTLETDIQAILTSLDADTLRAVIRLAVDEVNDSANRINAMEDKLNGPNENSDIVGPAEIGDMCRVEEHDVVAWILAGALPEPAVALSGVSLWLRSDIAAWARGTGRLTET